MRDMKAALPTLPQRTSRTIPMRPAAHTDRANDYEIFKEKVWTVSQQLERGGGGRRDVVPIAPLRRALAPMPHTTFNQHLLRLERNGLVYLIPPEDPAALGDEDRRDCVEHPSGDLRSFILWMSPKVRTASFWD